MGHTINHQTRKHKFGKIIGWIFLGIIAAIGFAAILGYAVMLLWNWIMPTIFELTVISFWQAIGLILLAKLLLGSFKHPKSNNQDNKFHKHFKNKFTKEKFSKWKHYDRFWKEKGEKEYIEFVEQLKNEE